jgi:hypothetical protein
VILLRYMRGVFQNKRATAQTQGGGVSQPVARWLALGALEALYFNDAGNVEPTDTAMACPRVKE